MKLLCKVCTITERKHRTKVNDSFSDFIDLLLGVPQGSILGRLLFNIYICDLFFFDEEKNVTSYADELHIQTVKTLLQF